MYAIKIVGGIVLLFVGILLAGASALMNWQTAGLALIAAATALILTA